MLLLVIQDFMEIQIYFNAYLAYIHAKNVQQVQEIVMNVLMVLIKVVLRVYHAI